MITECRARNPNSQHKAMVETPPQQKPKLTPPLESGDRLNSYEFERRYNAMPHLRKAELIEGVVYVPAALRFRSHGQPHGNLIIWLGNYKVATPQYQAEQLNLTNHWAKASRFLTML